MKDVEKINLKNAGIPRLRGNAALLRVAHEQHQLLGDIQPRADGRGSLLPIQFCTPARSLLRSVCIQCTHTGSQNK